MNLFHGINGLEEATCFDMDIPIGSSQRAIYQRYNDWGHKYLNK